MQERNYYLRFDGTFEDALSFVRAMRELQRSGLDYPKVFNDFLFAIEVRLQNEGYLDDNFNEVKGE